MLYRQDVLEGCLRFPDQSFDLAIADPPYGASTSASWHLPKDHALAGFGGRWEIAGHAWDLAHGGPAGFDFVARWLAELKRLVKPSGSIWIHATYHNAGIVNVACQLLGLEIINEVVWYKRNAFPNLSRRRLTASHETILWVHTGGTSRRYRFNYERLKAARFPEDRLHRAGKQLRTVWDIPNNKKREELRFGRHPTQKPLRLIERMLTVSAADGGRLLVPFAGAGSEMVAGVRFGMECVGFETNPAYFEIASRRLSHALDAPPPDHASDDGTPRSPDGDQVAGQQA